ncbi:MAG: hypothetical protein ACOCVV_09650 [Marinobacter sp.]
MSDPHRKHEPDARVGRGLVFLLVLTVPVLALVCLGLWLGFQAAIEAMAPASPEPFPSGGQQQEGGHTAPVLQEDPPQDLEAFNERSQERLNSTGWADREAGRVHIPIDQAMELLVERGLEENSS